VEVNFGISKRDQGVDPLAKTLDGPLHRISMAMYGEYGGPIENLWIDIEIAPSHADVRPEPWPLRFRKKVASPIGLPLDASHNVAHYSIRPDMLNVPLERAVEHVLRALYMSTRILEERGRRFPRFRAREFREKLERAIAAELGSSV
jgi:hypothetical protein